MIVLKIVLCLIILFVIPELIGGLITKFMKEKNNLLWAFVIGYLIEFAILELLAVPMIFLKLKFTTLLYTWSTIIGALLTVSFLLNVKKFSLKNVIEYLKKIKEKLNIISFLAIVLIFIQIIISVLYTHTDADDAFFVGTATTTITQNSMYRVAAENGSNYGKLPSRYVLSPFPLFTASISSIVHIHPAIVAHTIFPPVFILLAYIIYALIAQKLFDNNEKDTSIFLIFLSIIYIFGNVTRHTNFTFLLARIWQGKAILANIILPSIWLMALNDWENNTVISLFSLFITMIAACFVTEMGIALAPITLILFVIVFSIMYKKPSYLLRNLICMIPSIIYFGIYLMIK